MGNCKRSLSFHFTKHMELFLKKRKKKGHLQVQCSRLLVSPLVDTPFCICKPGHLRVKFSRSHHCFRRLLTGLYFTYNYKKLKSDPERALCSQKGSLWREVSFHFFVDDDVVVVVVVVAFLLLFYGFFLILSFFLRPFSSGSVLLLLLFLCVYYCLGGKGGEVFVCFLCALSKRIVYPLIVKHTACWL